MVLLYSTPFMLTENKIVKLKCQMRDSFQKPFVKCFPNMVPEFFVTCVKIKISYFINITIGPFLDNSLFCKPKILFNLFQRYKEVDIRLAVTKS